MNKLPETPVALKQDWYLADLQAALEKYNKVAVVKLELKEKV